MTEHKKRLKDRRLQGVIRYLRACVEGLVDPEDAADIDITVEASTGGDGQPLAIFHVYVPTSSARFVIGVGGERATALRILVRGRAGCLRYQGDTNVHVHGITPAYRRRSS